ncbi:paraquat-inducible protein A [Tropicimonas sp. IMCC34043]|uniref:paraquat-inducible protein A n=1 Tax=Tropicimonas sp. IMCC34043 TaxID=2248760 RepID=UPI000E265D57|nr:paraquat-inducible protein A [Tropicimonas sp. IMCC34043]
MADVQAEPRQCLTARQAGLVACTHCARVWPLGTETCGRCGKRLQSRDTHSMSRVWAWWVVGLICYIPANLFPMLKTTLLAKTAGSTIVGGAVELMAHGDIPVALVILTASVAIPMGKFVAVAYLALSVQHGWTHDLLRRMQLYEVVEFVGRWSMIDVFVVAVLSALVQLSVVVSIHPGPAAVTFALSVVFTMLSARSFDSRMIWDSLDAKPLEASKT